MSADPLEAPLTLKPTPRLPELLNKDKRGELPDFVNGDKISGRPDLDTVIEGNASLRKGDTAITADRLEYYAPDDTAKATGHVRVNQAGNVYEGPELQLKIETFEGFFNSVRYRFLATGGHGDAARIDFLDEYTSIARNATYTTCRREDYPGWMPAWIISAATIEADTEENVGVAKDARISFKGITTPALPSISFPLTNDRKSGLLPPIFGLDNTNGIELTTPYYWNIAPNRDATFTPTVMSKRGVNFGNDFRYLENTYSGEARVDYMPTDSLRNRERWGIWTRHQQTFDSKSLGLDSLTGSLNINRVSDDNYWSDFQRTPSFTQRLLSNDGSVNWTKGDFNGQFRALSYQTLQQPDSTIVPPYDRMPQVTANYNKYDFRGFDFSFNADYTYFRGDAALQQLLYPTQPPQPDGQRLFGVASLSRPFLTPGSFVIPKVMLNATAYQFDTPFFGQNSATRVVPTFSLDSGLVFERDANYFGRAFTQTLEPRAYYVYTPFRDQTKLPVYDSAQNDVSFATLFTENAFSGNDRISDSQLATLGLTSRLIDPDTGAEAARFGIAQSVRFKDQDVFIPTAGAGPITDKYSDILMGAQINWSPRWSTEATVQVDPDTMDSTRTTVGGRYSPGPYRTVSAAYRYQAPSQTIPAGSKSIDIGWQWPLNDLWGDKGQDLGPGRGQGGGRWYAVGRLNYSLSDNKMTDGIVGLEYDGCCWIGRIVLERLTTGLATANTRLMFQLEFVGFAAVGTSPMRSLQQNIQRYQPLRQPAPGPSRFTNYD
ncbi:LPS assembly protein LptD [Variovorax sp. J22R133]|uniref:LPS-assembly protein LptD n=1 Tax=Variovorax brevis TaxID=3053503 RepID=UPI002578E675|nr:LPS assembly protein LptD [Variovorax sp. J22R133]MDM0111765.1 LPS assembly protein LptD [Variovorax sp. J22R133]